MWPAPPVQARPEENCLSLTGPNSQDFCDMAETASMMSRVLCPAKAGEGGRAVLRVTSTSDTYRKPATLTESRNSGAGACETASSECSSSPGDVTGSTRSGSATGSAPGDKGSHEFPI